ncbi:hypothetical protein SDC9_22838 [bioreactor metagenome]|uniref:Uncharacterized protein n=1 Tax=bioreactor metagenome TaxID=1076179 RepID=A0A644UDH6_9ZZZZ
MGLRHAIVTNPSYITVVSAGSYCPDGYANATGVHDEAFGCYEQQGTELAQL